MKANDDQVCPGPGARDMESLCRSFPSLRGRSGAEPWDARIFAATFTGGQSEAEKQAAAFVLSVWNSGTPADGGWWNEGEYSVGAFNFARAYFLWDAEHRAAFRAWCDDPFWP